MTDAPAACPAPAIHPGAKTIALALQGGGAHGAFTWGALDRLLDDARVEVEGISGTSAGAMNAAAYKSGYVDGGRDGARAALDHLWTRIGDIARQTGFNPMLEWLKLMNPSLQLVSAAIEAGPASLVNAQLAQFFSPYQLNPFDLNPLRRILAEDLQFDRICRDCRPRLFIAATRVRDGKISIFQGERLSVDAILASTCLPSMFQAVEIPCPVTGKVEAFWDGGFTGNPALFPLYDGVTTRDVVIVHINPRERDDVPKTAAEIENRVNEISFNAALNAELRAISFVRELLERGVLQPGEKKDVLIHSVADDDTMRQLGAGTKTTPDAFVLSKLKEAGQAAMDRFLTDHWGDLGQRATAPVAQMYG